jgi:hypothetical protein
MTKRPETPPVPGHLPDVQRLPLRPESPEDTLRAVLNTLPARAVIVHCDESMLMVDELAMLFNRRPKS